MSRTPSEQLVFGVVQEALPSSNFRVMVSDEILLCYLCGKMRMHHIRVMPGDKVSIKMSPDGKRGIIMRRV